MISASCRETPPISCAPVSTLFVKASISITPDETLSCISLTTCSISREATAVWSASRRISRAITRNPRPYSPAFSASIAALIERRLVWSATFAIVVTARLIVVARSLITASRDPNDSVLSASFRIVASMLDRFSLPSIAMAPVFPAISFTATMVCVSSFPVTLISSTAATVCVVESPSRLITCC